MNERLLHFIWQYQYYSPAGLTTHRGEKIQVVFPGQYNQNQGPDFADARIRIGPALWIGSVELHIKTSDWQKHQHGSDENYRNVILHVVWQHDQAATEDEHADGANDIPVLELQDRVSKLLLQRYDQLMQSPVFIPCENMAASWSTPEWKAWQQQLAIIRLQRKAGSIFQQLEQTNRHWEEVFWWQLARNFGMKVNADAFEAIARSIPLNLLARQRNQIHRLEALLLGQANLLRKPFEEDYPAMLKKEYEFLRHQFGLRPALTRLLFLRMRPVNFPTVRLAQLAALIQRSSHLFALIRETADLSALRSCFQVTANDYWHYHYRPDEPAPYSEKSVGDSMIDSILINTVVPMLFAYSLYHNDAAAREKALNWLRQTRAENNSLLSGFARLGIPAADAQDSQALIELKTRFCDARRCLDCEAGNGLLKNR